MNYTILSIIGVLIIISIFTILLLIIKKKLDPVKENVDFLTKRTSMLKNNMDILDPLLDTENVNLKQLANQSSPKIINSKQFLNPKDWALLGPGSYDGIGGDTSKFMYAFTKTFVPPKNDLHISQFAWYHNYNGAGTYGGVIYGIRYSTVTYGELIDNTKTTNNTWGDWYYFKAMKPGASNPDVLGELFK